MSLANTRLQALRKPKITQLPEDRLRVQRWFKILHEADTHADKLTLDIFGGYGLLDGTTDSTFTRTERPDTAFANCRLISEEVEEQFDRSGRSWHQLVQVYETLTATWAAEDADKPSSTDNGLRLLTRSQVAETGTAAPYDEDDVGISTITQGGKTLYLAGFDDDSDDRRGRFITRWAEAGILEADKEFAKDGLLYVTFESQGTKATPTCLKAGSALTDDPLVAFQGGAAAQLRFDRIRKVNGFRRYIVTVMMQLDGSPLTSGTEVLTRTTWDEYSYPGYVETSFANGIVPFPGGNISVLVTISDTMSTSNTVGVSPVPFSIKNGCSVNINYIPTETGLAESISKGFGTNYLAGTIGISGTNATFLGMDVDSITGTGSSDPTYAAFLATNNPVLDREIFEDFVTDAGVRWYRIRQKQLIGTFGDYD